MRGDFSRITFDSDKRFDGVLNQQGRVQLDADWNEQVAIGQHRDRTTAIDVIGKCGVPKHGGGFAISTQRDLLAVHSHNGIHLSVGTDGYVFGRTTSRLIPPIDTELTLRAVHVGNEIAWIVGDDGATFRNALDGSKWVAEESGTKRSLHGVAAIDAERAWAVGVAGTILAWNGRNWKPQQSRVRQRLNAVMFLNEDVGWVAGDSGVIQRTTNGGATWEAQDSGVNVTLRSVYFLTKDTGWAVGDGGTILQTQDGGKEWKPRQPKAKLIYYGVQFLNEEVGFIVGSAGTLMRSTNGGQTWQSVDTGTSETLRGITFSTRGDESAAGAAVGNSLTYLTTVDDGKDWQLRTDVPAVVTGAPYFFDISPGRAWVDGVSCELDQRATWLTQSELPNPSPVSLEDVVNQSGRTDLVYLDVWQRHISTIEDPQIREAALGGPDTTTRLRTVCQVKIHPDVGSGSCSQPIPDWPPSSGGRLTTQLKSAGANDNPCELPPTSDYRGLENQLYRVEIHDGGDLGEATFKWSRENASVALPIIEFVANNQVRVATPNRAISEMFAPGNWVEVLGDESELNERPGTLARITADGVDEAQRVITLNLDVSAHRSEAHVKVRRWDQETKTLSVAAGPIEIEAGIEARFSGSRFRTGDYWVFAARTANGDIQRLTNASPAGVRHHFCRLALLNWSVIGGLGGLLGWRAEVEDCRRQFPPLTELPTAPAEEEEPAITIGGVYVFGANDVPIPLQLDAAIPSDVLAKGIRIDIGTPGTSVNLDVRGRPLCTVTLDIPYPMPSEAGFWDYSGQIPLLGYRTLRIAESLRISETDRSNLLWLPQDSSKDWLEQRIAVLFNYMQQNKWGDRVLSRLVVKGNFLWHQDPQTNQLHFLDGTAFSEPAPGGGVRLRLPSGDGVRGGDFEMWFWLTTPSPRVIVIERIGLIRNTRSPVMGNTQAVEAIDIGLNRSDLKPLLPPNYTLSDVSFDLTTARKRLEELSLPNRPVTLLHDEKQAELAKQVQINLQQMSLQTTMVSVTRATIVERATAAGAQIDMVLGDHALSKELTATGSPLFDGSMIRF